MLKPSLLYFAALVGAAKDTLFSQYDHAVVAFAGAATVVFEDYLYIQGPLVFPDNTWQSRIWNNHLFAIDLTRSWNNRSVRSVTLPAASRPNEPVLFASNDTRTLYLWGTGNPALQVFELPDPSNPAKPGWNTARHQPPSSFPNSNGSLSARGPNTLYSLGNWLPSKDAFIEFDASSNTWTRISANPYGNAADGAGLYVPTYGDQGILVFLGGERPYDHNSENITLVRFYDIATNKFFFQSATSVGSTPSNRRYNCIVGAEDADGGGYDIFMYGGFLHGQPTDALKIRTVWVLSLPSFQWVQVPGSATKRSRTWHSCEVIGRRQMIVAGGYPKDGEIIDEFAQGLGIFDMSALRWSSSYDPNAAAYKRSNFLSNAIGKNTYPQRWDSPEAKRVFTAAGNNSSSDLNTAATAAGVTVGTVGLTLIALIIWIVRRKRRTAVEKQSHEYDEDKTVVDTRPPSVVYHVSPIQELPLEYPRRELIGSPIATELLSPANERRLARDGDKTVRQEHVYELPAEDHEVFPIRCQ